MLAQRTHGPPTGKVPHPRKRVRFRGSARHAAASLCKNGVRAARLRAARFA